MKIKEVIVLAYLSRTTITPLLLSFENESMYLHIDPQGCALFKKDSSEPVYQIHEPLLLAHGVMTDSQTVHLVLLKTSGELCYSLISGPSMPQTTLIAKLDVRSTIYRRLFLFPQGKLIHIFYAYSHQAIRDLWHIEHRCWNGFSWQSAHMGEVVHQQVPLYHVNIDSQGSLHLLTITCQGRHSLFFTNRFNGTFHIWGSPTETLKISGEVMDIAALMTSDNVQHLYWVVKTANGQFEVRGAQQADAHELASTWHLSPAPIKTFSSPWKNLGALEKNGVLWLLAHTGEEILMQNDGTGWKLISSHTPFHLPIQWVHQGKKNFHQTYWLEDQVERHTPAYYHELGLTIKNQTDLLPASCQSFPTQALPLTPPPVPAFYPELLSPSSYPARPVSIPENELDSMDQVPPIDEASDTPFSCEVLESCSEDLQPQPLIDFAELENLITTVALLEQENAELQRLVPTVAHLEHENAELQRLVPTVAHLEHENAELQRLISTVAHLEQENADMNLLLRNVLSMFEQIMEDTAKNDLEADQEIALPALAEIHFNELEPVKEAMSNLEKETQSLSQVLRVMLVKQEESHSSLEKLETQLSELQTSKEDVKAKGGFWNKWIT